jgi:hypothetical protein
VSTKGPLEQLWKKYEPVRVALAKIHKKFVFAGYMRCFAIPNFAKVRKNLEDLYKLISVYCILYMVGERFGDAEKLIYHIS